MYLASVIYGGFWWVFFSPICFVCRIVLKYWVCLLWILSLSVLYSLRHRPQRLCVDAEGPHVEAHACHPAHQPRCSLCALGPQGEQVRCGQWLPCHLHLLFWAGKWLVGVQAHQEAHPLHRPQPGLAPQQRAPGRRLLRLQMPDLLSLHQGGGGAASTHPVGLQDAVRRADVWVQH